MSSKIALDRRAARTRQWLHQALLDLLPEKEYASITIAEVTERAGLARPTFYLHFKSKDELLLSLLDLVFEQFYADIDSYLVGDAISAPVGVRLFEQAQGQAGLLRVISQAGADALLVQRFQAYILRVFRRFLEKNHPGRGDPRLLDFVADYLAGASWAMIRRWIETGMPHSPQVMGQIYYELIQPGLTNALVRGSLDGWLGEAM